MNKKSVSYWRYIGKTEFHKKEIWECIRADFATVVHSDQISDQKYEILGRPITLADVLLVLNAIRSDLVVDCGGRFWHAEPLEICPVYWNLSIGLEDQSPECLQFLADLLDNK